MYFFHIFESVVNNTSIMVGKYSSQLIEQCPKNVRQDIEKIKNPMEKQGDKSKKDFDKLNAAIQFNDNAEHLKDCKKRIDGALASMEEYIALSRKLSSVKSNIPYQGNGGESYQQMINKLMMDINTAATPDEMKASQGGSGESGNGQPWTLGELESIVYDFLNFNDKKPVNEEFLETRLRFQDVK